jgi:hypothetical protein
MLSFSDSGLIGTNLIIYRGAVSYNIVFTTHAIELTILRFSP